MISSDESSIDNSTTASHRHINTIAPIVRNRCLVQPNVSRSRHHVHARMALITLNRNVIHDETIAHVNRLNARAEIVADTTVRHVETVDWIATKTRRRCVDLKAFLLFYALFYTLRFTRNCTRMSCEAVSVPS